MAEVPFTEEDVQRYAEMLHAKICNCGSSDNVQRDDVRAVLGALVEDGRLRGHRSGQRPTPRLDRFKAMIERAIVSADWEPGPRRCWRNSAGSSPPTSARRQGRNPPMSTETYIREYYGVPAQVGGRIMFGWQGPRVGTITGFAEGRLLVRFDGEQESKPLHPTWEVQYFDQEPESGQVDRG